jgi:hypothetical protein
MIPTMYSCRRDKAPGFRQKGEIAVQGVESRQGDDPPAKSPKRYASGIAGPLFFRYRHQFREFPTCNTPIIAAELLQKE